MKTLNIYLVYFFILIVFTNQGQPSWTRITPTPQENTINCITKIPGTNKLIAVGEGSTVMITDDEGETWQIHYNPAGTQNENHLRTVYFFNSSIGFIGGNYYVSDGDTYIYYILRTTDSGLSWTINTEIPGKINDFYFVNQDTGFAAGYHGKLLKTIDGGENWDTIISGVDFTLKAIDFCNDSTGYIIGYSIEKVLKTTDKGNTWNEVDFVSPLTGSSLSEIQFVNDTTGFVAQHNGSILKTTNAGAFWDIIFTDENIWVKTIDFYDENHGIAACYKVPVQSCILTTHDGGITWSEFTLPEFQSDNYSVCCYDENSSLFTGYMGMIFKSVDGGYSWEPRYERTFWGKIFQVQYLDDNNIFCLANDKLDPYGLTYLYKSSDGGENYCAIANFAVNEYNLKPAVAFYFLDQDVGFVTYYHYESLLTVKKTSDGGNTWTEVESGNFDYKPFAVKFFNEQNGIITGLYFILKTTDGGNTWTEEYFSAFPGYDLMDIHYFNANHIIATGGRGFYSAFMLSQDGGNTWEEMLLGYYGEIFDIEIVNNNITYLACGDNVILKSPDCGSTWQYTQINNINDIEFHSIHFPTENIGYAVGSGPYETMVKTTDGGETWNVINSEITSGFNAVHFYDEYTGYAYGDKGVILKTTTGGTTGINQSQSKKTKTYFTVYPNPFTKFFNIQYFLPNNSNGGTIEIISQSGNRKLKQLLKNSIGKIELQSENLKPGIYLISLKIDNTIIETQKIIKLH